MATRSEALAPTWKEGSVTSWLTTADHKRIGILYIVTSFLFFGAAGVMALLMRIQLSHSNAGFLTCPVAVQQVSSRRGDRRCPGRLTPV